MLSEREWEILVIGILMGSALTGLFLVFLMKFGGIF